jgi:CHAD domain-containing protein
VKKARKRESETDLHRLRLAVKKLRYGAEALSGCLPQAEIEPLLSAARRLQDELGMANDCVVGRRLLSGLSAGLHGAPKRIVRLAQVNGAFLQLLVREERRARKRALKALPKVARLAGKKRMAAFFPAQTDPGS